MLTKKEALDIEWKMREGTATREEILQAAKFWICISAPRRSARPLVCNDVQHGLELLRSAGFPNIPFLGSFGTDEYKIAKRAAEWFEKTFPEAFDF